MPEPAPVLPEPQGSELVVLPPGQNTQSDEIMSVMESVVDSIVTGKQITSKSEQIEKLIQGQESRAELISNLLLTNDYTRLMSFMRSRAKIEKALHAAMESEALTPSEQLSFLAYCREEMEVLQHTIKAGATNVKDIMVLLEKIDYTFSVNQKDINKKLAGTAPYAREIIRRTASRLNKQAAKKPKRIQTD